ncbi:MAG: c-type cytochrome [Blastocatellia bacterium]|nr:c-type cytochrome [Blastocatellia bacterium]
MKSPIWKLSTVVMVIALAITLYGQQGPPPAKNLKVLPKEMPRQQLMGIMNGWTRSLGVKCDHCHVDDKASDEKPVKDVARAMVKMMMNLRQNANEFLPDNRVQKVSCWTCHRGSAKIEVPAPPTPPQGQPAPPKPPQQ